MNRSIKIGAAAATLAGIALAGAGAASASATQPERSAGQTATQADPPPRDVWVNAVVTEVKSWGDVVIPSLTCPKQHPYLVDQNYSPGRIVPRGVQVLEPGGVGVTIPFVQKRVPNEPGWVIGTSGAGAMATNYGFSDVKLTIRLHCSASPTDGYWAP